MDRGVGESLPQRPALGHVLHLPDEVAGPALVVADARHAHRHPYLAAVGVAVPLLDPVAVGALGHQASHLGRARVAVVGVREVVHVHAAQPVRVASHDAGHGGIGPQDVTVEVGHGHPDGGVLEGGAEPFVRVPQGVLGLLAGADVVEVGDDTPDVGVSETVGDRGLEPQPRTVRVLQPQLAAPSLELVRAHALCFALHAGEVVGVHQVGRHAGVELPGRDPEDTLERGAHVPGRPLGVDHHDDVRHVAHERLETALGVTELVLDRLPRRDRPTEQHDREQHAEQSERGQPVDERLADEAGCDPERDGELAQGHEHHGPHEGRPRRRRPGQLQREGGAEDEAERQDRSPARAVGDDADQPQQGAHVRGQAQAACPLVPQCRQHDAHGLGPEDEEDDQPVGERRHQSRPARQAQRDGHGRPRQQRRVVRPAPQAGAERCSALGTRGTAFDSSHEKTSSPGPLSLTAPVLDGACP